MEKKDREMGRQTKRCANGQTDVAEVKISGAKLRSQQPYNLSDVFQGSRDNMSIIIIAFPAAPKVDSEAQRKDEELNKLLKQKVEGNTLLFLHGTYTGAGGN
jgi:Protein serine/threonine phosphatase 2C, C-terminal domain